MAMLYRWQLASRFKSSRPEKYLWAHMSPWTFFLLQHILFWQNTAINWSYLFKSHTWTPSFNDPLMRSRRSVAKPLSRPAKGSAGTPRERELFSCLKRAMKGCLLQINKLKGIINIQIMKKYALCIAWRYTSRYLRHINPFPSEESEHEKSNAVTSSLQRILPMFHLRKDWRTPGCFKNNLCRINLLLVNHFSEQTALKQSLDVVWHGLPVLRQKWLSGVKLVQENRYRHSTECSKGEQSAFGIYLEFVNWEQVGRKVCFLL